MKVTLFSGKYNALKVDLIAVPVFLKDTKNKFLQSLGKSFVEEYNRALKNKEFSGKFGERLVMPTFGKLPASNIVLIGLGKKKDLTKEQLRRGAAVAQRVAKAKRVKRYLSLFGEIDLLSVEDRLFVLAESALLTDYSFNKYKTQNVSDRSNVSELVISVVKVGSYNGALKRAEIVSSATNLARDLVNLPPNVVYPSYLAKEALKLKSANCKVTVLDEKALAKGKFGGILAVGMGSVRKPRVVVLDYNPKGAKKTVALVGKGITFDSGGLNIKPGAYMETMKCDMAGAAAVLGIIKAAQGLQVKHRVVGVMCCAENMPSGVSYRPDDILTMYNGKTVEVGNTDAEGRLVLADGLAFVEKRYKPDQIIDYATLTGACVVALGYHAAALLTKDDSMASTFYDAGEDTGDRTWRLPLWDDWMDRMKSSVADVRNIASGRDSGTITAAVFLSHFVEKTPWAHIDIAGTAFLKEAKFYHPKNGTGAGVRMTLNYLKRL